MRVTGRSRSALAWCAALLAVAGCSDAGREERRARAGAGASPERLMAVADAAAGARAFRQCAQCHTVRAGAPDLAGPNLHGVYGRAVAQGSARFGYTGALRSAGGRWDAATLDRWLADPRAAVPGTSMAFAGIRDPLERADVIAFLRAESAKM